MLMTIPLRTRMEIKVDLKPVDAAQEDLSHSTTYYISLELELELVARLTATFEDESQACKVL